MNAFETLSTATTKLDLSLLPPPPERSTSTNTDYNLADLQSALFSLPQKYVDEYGEWLRVGAALRRADPDLLWLWKLWSQQSDKYQNGDCERKWDSFGESEKPATVGTIFHWAIINGWRFPGRKPIPAKVTYEILTNKQLNEGDFSIEWLISGLLVANQPCIIGGAQKTLKTSLAVDAAVSLGTGTHFLGHQTKRSKTLVMSGESGLGVLQETMRRVCRSKGIHPSDIEDWLQWTTNLPRFGQIEYIEPLGALLQDRGIEVLFIDPVYLAMAGDDANNLMKQGELLRSIGEVCGEAGTTLMLLHHFTKEAARSKSPPELTNFAWSGFGEFARQWWLLKRRSEYIEGAGQHELFMSIGGSAGHSERLALDIDEGRIDDLEGRKWNIDVQRLRQLEQSTKKAQLDIEAERIVLALREHGELNKGELEDLTGLSRRRLPQVLAHINGEIVQEKRGRHKIYRIS